MKYIKASNGMNFMWMKWFKKYRWAYWECSKPVWLKPHFEKYIFGWRMGWLLFAIGTGVVNKEQMEIVKKNLCK